MRRWDCVGNCAHNRTGPCAVPFSALADLSLAGDGMRIVFRLSMGRFAVRDQFPGNFLYAAANASQVEARSGALAPGALAAAMTIVSAHVQIGVRQAVEP